MDGWIDGLKDVQVDNPSKGFSVPMYLEDEFWDRNLGECFSKIHRDEVIQHLLPHQLFSYLVNITRTRNNTTQTPTTQGSTHNGFLEESIVSWESPTLNLQLANTASMLVFYFVFTNNIGVKISILLQRPLPPRWVGTWEATAFRPACPQSIQNILPDIPSFEKVGNCVFWCFASIWFLF